MKEIVEILDKVAKQTGTDFITVVKCAKRLGIFNLSTNPPSGLK